MLKHNETRIIRIVAVCEGEIRPPCGKCCDLIRMMNEKNIEAETLVSMNEAHMLRELLPYPWLRSKRCG